MPTEGLSGLSGNVDDDSVWETRPEGYHPEWSPSEFMDYYRVVVLASKRTMTLGTISKTLYFLAVVEQL